MNKLELINQIASQINYEPNYRVKLAVNLIIDYMITTLSSGERIEIRGFGSFIMKYRKERMGYNPKSGNKINFCSRYIIHFKPGKFLSKKVAVG